VRTLDQGGGVLGVFPAWTYQDSSVDLSSGDRLLLFTDGITEAEGPDGEEFGMEQVAAFAEAHAANSAARMNQQLLAQVTEKRRRTLVWPRRLAVLRQSLQTHSSTNHEII
jgi:phosphoserine phosphatase RsbU/P